MSQNEINLPEMNDDNLIQKNIITEQKSPEEHKVAKRVNN